MKKTHGYLYISSNIVCPECNKGFDLFYRDELKKNHFLYKRLFSYEGWGCKGFSVEYQQTLGKEFQCPKCNKKIIIESMEPM